MAEATSGAAVTSSMSERVSIPKIGFGNHHPVQSRLLELDEILDGLLEVFAVGDRHAELHLNLSAVVPNSNGG
jgi:hypothetical protein